MNEKVKAGATQDVADANANTELVPEMIIYHGCLLDMSGNCGDVDHPVDFTHPKA